MHMHAHAHVAHERITYMYKEETIGFPFEFDAQAAATSARVPRIVVLLRHTRTDCGRVCERFTVGCRPTYSQYVI